MSSSSKNPSLEILAEAQVKWSESKAKVASAVSNIFRRDGELRVEDDRIQFVSEKISSLQFLKDQFRDRRIRATARRLLHTNRGESGNDSTYLLLNKQAATVSIAALCDDPKESALGPIVLRIRSSDLDYLIDWLTEGFDRS